MRRLVLVLFCVLLAVSASAQRRRGVGGGGGQPQQPVAGEPLAGLNAQQREAFAEGRDEFREAEEITDGLGPVFNDRSCAGCHSAPAIGGGSRRTVTRFGRRTIDGAFDPLVSLGGSLIQERAININGFRGERVPQQANSVARRRTPPLFGLGLVDATPDATFIAMAQLQLARGDGTAGRAALVDNMRAGMKTVGKFGWKSQVPTLLQFSGDAYVNEMGITSPDFPNENCPQGNCAELARNPAPGINDDGSGVAALHDFMTLLAPPSRGPQNADTAAGELVFNQLGCGSCHVATLQSGSSPIAALDRRTYHPYSDFLLHDMGALGDGIDQGAANGREMRTAPLWGLRFVNSFLHDGRANTIDQAILAHDGQARTARDRFAALAADLRAKLMAFLQSL